MAIILSIYQVYPHKVSQLISLVKFFIRFLDTLYPLCFPEENYDTLEYSKVKCYSGDPVRLRNLYSIENKKHQ